MIYNKIYKLSKINRLFKSGNLLHYLKFNYGFYKRKAILKYDPLDLIVNVTNYCNLKCKMCPHGNPKFFYQRTKEKYKKMYIPLNYVAKALTKFPGIINVQVAGIGEPFLHQEIYELLEIINNKKKLINIVTNGTLLNFEMIDKLLDLEYLDEIQVSLDAHDSETYFYITGGNKYLFNKVIANILYIVQHKKRGQKVKVSNVTSKEDLPNVKSFVDLAVSLGVDEVSLQDYCLDHPNIGVYGKYKSTLTPLTDNEIISMNSDLKNKYQNIIQLRLPKYRNKKLFSKKCFNFFKTLHINADGYIGSCGRDMLPEKEFGHIEDQEVWNNDYMVKNRLLFLRDDMELNECCLDCSSNY